MNPYTAVNQELRAAVEGILQRTDSLLSEYDGTLTEEQKLDISIIFDCAGGLWRLFDELPDLSEIVLDNHDLKQLAHAIRTPLNAIIGFGQTLCGCPDMYNNAPLTSEQQRDLQSIQDYGLTLLYWVKDVLDYDAARLALGSMPLAQEPFDLAQVIAEVRDITANMLKNKPVDVYLAVEEDLPYAFGDAFRTRQVLLNLVTNADKYTYEGSITLGARLVVDADERPMLELAVADTGTGVAPEHLDTLFDISSGFGLTVAAALVEMQGGAIGVESEYGAGATFYFTLPLVPDGYEN